MWLRFGLSAPGFRTFWSFWWLFRCPSHSGGIYSDSPTSIYQVKWAVYRAWCRRHGHSVSRPSVPKTASFHLYLRCCLSLSFSSIASYRSMLSGVFRFVLPELSSYFVLQTFSAFSTCSALSPLLGFLLGIFPMFFLFSVVLPLSLSLPVLFGSSLGRSSFC